MEMLPKEVARGAMRLFELHDSMTEINDRRVFRFAIIAMFFLLLERNKSILEREEELRTKLLKILKEEQE